MKYRKEETKEREKGINKKKNRRKKKQKIRRKEKEDRGNCVGMWEMWRRFRRSAGKG